MPFRWRTWSWSCRSDLPCCSDLPAPLSHCCADVGASRQQPHTLIYVPYLSPYSIGAGASARVLASLVRGVPLRPSGGGVLGNTTADAGSRSSVASQRRLDFCASTFSLSEGGGLGDAVLEHRARIILSAVLATRQALRDFTLADGNSTGTGRHHSVLTFGLARRRWQRKRRQDSNTARRHNIPPRQPLDRPSDIADASASYLPTPFMSKVGPAERERERGSGRVLAEGWPHGCGAHIRAMPTGSSSQSAKFGPMLATSGSTEPPSPISACRCMCVKLASKDLGAISVRLPTWQFGGATSVSAQSFGRHGWAGVEAFRASFGQPELSQHRPACDRHSAKLCRHLGHRLGQVRVEGAPRGLTRAKGGERPHAWPAVGLGGGS